MPCRCDSNPCSTCICAKSNTLCTSECHGKKDWASIPCLNTEVGKKVKSMAIKDIRTALCTNQLSPIGDKSELIKRLAVFFQNQKETNSNTPVSSKLDSSTASNNKRLFETILENEGNHELILSLSGRTVTKVSSKPELRRAYLILSSKVHPDKNSSSKESVQAFQVVLNAFERLSNPDKFEEESEIDKPAKKRQKTEQFTRSNAGCFKTKIKCPQCKQTWGGNELGLEDGAYNFFMMAIKTYICGRCSCEFGCMTAIHYCPLCNKTFEYDPDDYHRQIICGNENCIKKFGFMMFKVSARRESEVRAEAKLKHEQYLKRISQKNRRAARSDKRSVKVYDAVDDHLQEKLFIIGLRDVCPRCGWELDGSQDLEEAKLHLDSCNNEKEIEDYKRKLKEAEAKNELKNQKEASQAEIMGIKQWEHNGRQVGQLWMLSDAMLKKLCVDLKLKVAGLRHEIIARLSEYLRSNQRLMITDGKNKKSIESNFDTTPLAKVDTEDLPKNINLMEREELQDLCASYGVKFDAQKDVKSVLIKKFESARMSGQSKLMICGKQEDSEESLEEFSDTEYDISYELKQK